MGRFECNERAGEQLRNAMLEWMSRSRVKRTVAEGRVSRLNAICVVDGSGEIVSEGTVISEPEAIAGFIKTNAVSAKRIGLETGPTTTWLWHELGALRETLKAFRESGIHVPAGTAAAARSTEALRCLIEASASSTLIRQRPLTPSCGGQSPYRGENSGPGRHITESLTSNPRVREQPQPRDDISSCRQRTDSFIVRR